MKTTTLILLILLFLPQLSFAQVVNIRGDYIGAITLIAPGTGECVGTPDTLDMEFTVEGRKRKPTLKDASDPNTIIKGRARKKRAKIVATIVDSETARKVVQAFVFKRVRRKSVNFKLIYSLFENDTKQCTVKYAGVLARNR